MSFFDRQLHRHIIHSFSFRARSDIALEIGMSEEEAEYIHTLLDLQYQQLGRIKFHETVCIL